MPTYEYECAECGHAFERFESMTAKPDPTCPKCNRKKAKRLISAGGGLLFKGSGFYCTDYRSSSYKSAATKDTGSSTSSKSESSPTKADKSSTKDSGSSTSTKSESSSTKAGKSPATTKK
jgi:putative FmdB family regulatory protein